MRDKTELLPCPFCGGDGEPMHADNCYFTLQCKIKEAPKGDLSLVPKLLAAWNRRATIQPTAAEPVAFAWFHRGMVNFDAEDALAALDDGKGTPIKLYTGLVAVAPADAVRDVRDAQRYRELNTPEIADFVKGVEREALHQRERWSASHDAGKAPEDWFWLLGYLGGKALHAAKTGDTDKALHHTISSAAALLNWHAAILGTHSAMRPGIEPPTDTPKESTK